MIDIIPILSLFGAIDSPSDFCRNISIVWHGDNPEQLLENLFEQNLLAETEIERISERILYAPTMYNVQDKSQTQPREIYELRELRANLEPLQISLGGTILSSAMILTPNKLHQAMNKNPWDVLMGVRPMEFFTAKIPYEAIRVQFKHSGVQYTGWHMLIALSRLFDCNINTSINSEIKIDTPIPIRKNNQSKIIKAPPPVIVRPNRYVTNMDGTVSDTENGIMWKRCSEGQTWTGVNCTGNAHTMTLDQALNKQINRTLWQRIHSSKKQAWPTFAGYDDWRLPNCEELRSLVWCSNGTSQEEAWKYGCGGMNGRNGTYQAPTLDISVFPNTPLWQFWSSSLYNSNPNRAWVVYFGYGCINDFAGSYNYAVRLVRDEK
ncbi:hypothetical protein TI05_05585 [Achromatium sp. WMS3]|nr:hypothetical protein TI05_05585 [Achromatium sp. WMS3]